jgi:rubredoxin
MTAPPGLPTRVPAPVIGPGMSTDAPTDAPGDPGQASWGSIATGSPDAEAALTDETTPSPASPEAEPDGAEAPVDDPASHRFECRSCGYVYDPGEGIRKLAIEPGTSFLELDPVSFRCPVCRSRVGAFRDIGPRSKPSGFEENLDFGLGVNRLTPGQKNVLIFGGFALAIAFFLSLYSLR